MTLSYIQIYFSYICILASFASFASVASRVLHVSVASLASVVSLASLASLASLVSLASVVSLASLSNKREISVKLLRHSVSKHHHINKDKCRDYNGTVFRNKWRLIEYVSHHHINDDSNHGRMCQHDSSPFVCHRSCSSL